MGRFPKKSGREVLGTHERLPAWIAKEKTSLSQLHDLKVGLRESHLHTVCEEARCPNRTHCFSHGTATFLLLGDVCTRACGFCSIKNGKPLSLDPHEPEDTASRVEAMGLRYAVLTSVNRDDLPDGGSAQFAETIRAIRRRCPSVSVEVLIPDFMGDLEAVTAVVEAGPVVLNHNVETVPSLYSIVRPAGRFERSLSVLQQAKRLGRDVFGDDFKTKSGLMLGLGENQQELIEVFQKLRSVGVDILTLGQYLRPTRYQLPVARYVPPEEFESLAKTAKDLGFLTVYAGPLVRSSFNAFEVSQQDGIAIL
ncbi:lipoyl synthase [Acidobacteriota bacterium]|nr:lipoyl synthase [Acidobacteriota bacterium]